MDSKLNRFFNLVSLMGVCFLAIPMVLLVLGTIGIPGGPVILPSAAVASVVLGYTLQHISARVLGQRVSSDGYADLMRGIMPRFRVRYALVPLVLLIVLALILNSALDSLFTRLAERETLYPFAEYSGAALLCAIMFFLCGMSGVAVWFYPMERLSNIYVIIFGGAIFLLEFMLSFISPDMAVAMSITGGCFAFFVICMMVIYNQSNLQRTYRGTVVSTASPSARFYNLFLVLFLLLFLLLVIGCVYIVLSGLYLIGSFLVFLVLYKIFYNRDGEKFSQKYEYVDPEETAADFTKTMVENGSETILPVFLMLVLVIVLLLLGSRSGILQKIVRYVSDVIREFFYTIKVGKQIIAGTDPYDFYDLPKIRNYRDEKKRLQDAAIKEYMKMAEGTDTYKLFTTRLAKLPDSDAQLTFAYVMLIAICRRKCSNLRLSDTPREMKTKVVHLISKEDMDEITEQFERIKYGEQDLSPFEAARLLDRMCVLIKRYIF